jgi:adenosylcobinamide hydrolase
VHPELTRRRDEGRDLPVLVWRPAEPVLAISSGALGGGIGTRHWVVNATVPLAYDRPDPHVHLAELAADLGLDGTGTGLLTAVDVATAVTVRDGGVTVCATVGLSDPIWAAAPDSPGNGTGTINVVAWLPVRLTDAALVNAVATVAEAKAQALDGLGIPGTGTCTDATVLACPTGGPAQWYGGPRSTYGARLARAVHEAVLTGGRGWLDSDRVREKPSSPRGTYRT